MLVESVEELREREAQQLAAAESEA